MMVEDEVYKGHIYGFFDEATDFAEPSSGGLYSLSAPLIDIAASADINQIPVATGANTVGYVRVTRTGVISSAWLIANSNLAQSDTNYITFTFTNLGRAGTGTTAELATTPAGVNTTKTTGGQAISAGVPYIFTLSATAANLTVNAGDVIKVIATVTGTLANVVDMPQVFLGFSSVGGLSGLWQPFTFRTAGSPSVTVLANTADGVAQIKLDPTSEAQTAGISWGDQLLLNKPDSPVSSVVNVDSVEFRVFEAYLQIPVALTTNQRLLVGVGTAMSATNTSISKILAFHLEANMVPTLDARDGTNTNNQLAATRPLTLVAGQFYRFSISWVDAFNCRFRIDDHSLGTVTMGAIAATDLFQPFVYLQKASGVSVPSVLVDYLRAQCRRY